MSNALYKSKDFAESVARSLRCCGVRSAYVKEIVAYEVIVTEKNVMDIGETP